MILKGQKSKNLSKWLILPFFSLLIGGQVEGTQPPTGGEMPLCPYTKNLCV